MNVIGFTGTRKGLQARQHASLTKFVLSFDGGEIHHGDCIGADAQFHKIARTAGRFHIVGHPGHDKYGLAPNRAYCEVDRLLESLPYLERNRAIVDNTGLLLACPNTMFEQQQSGTWSTIRYALKYKKNTIIFYPDGTFRSFFFYKESYDENDDQTNQ